MLSWALAWPIHKINEFGFNHSATANASSASRDLPRIKHLGIYAYTNETLQTLSKLKPTENEESEKLEQLRFLDNGFNIFVEDFVCEAPIGIDTPEDLKAANIFAKQNDWWCYLILFVCKQMQKTL